MGRAAGGSPPRGTVAWSDHLAGRLGHRRYRRDQVFRARLSRVARYWVAHGGRVVHAASVCAGLGVFGHGSALCRSSKLADTQSSGRTAGNLYAISTIGSIVGTFLAGFVLIAWVGSTNILLLMAAVLSRLPCWQRAAAPASKRRHPSCSYSCLRWLGATMFS